MTTPCTYRNAQNSVYTNKDYASYLPWQLLRASQNHLSGSAYNIVAMKKKKQILNWP